MVLAPRRLEEEEAKNEIGVITTTAKNEEVLALTIFDTHNTVPGGDLSKLYSYIMERLYCKFSGDSISVQ